MGSTWRDDVEGVDPLETPPAGCDVEFFTNVRTWLHSLPRGATVTWGQHHLCVGGVHTSWVDVLVPAAQEATHTNWLVTIDAPDVSEDVADPGDVVESVLVEHDVAISGRFDPFDWWDVDTVTVHDTPNPALTLDEGYTVWPAWSDAALCRGLRRWAHLVAGRGDLVWVHDPDMTSEQAERAEEILDEVLEGSSELTDLGGGVLATPEMFDELAADPDAAAEMMKQLRRVMGADIDIDPPEND